MEPHPLPPLGSSPSGGSGTCQLSQSFATSSDSHHSMSADASVLIPLGGEGETVGTHYHVQLCHDEARPEVSSVEKLSATTPSTEEIQTCAAVITEAHVPQCIPPVRVDATPEHESFSSQPSTSLSLPTEKSVAMLGSDTELTFCGTARHAQADSLASGTLPSSAVSREPQEAPNTANGEKQNVEDTAIEMAAPKEMVATLQEQNSGFQERLKSPNARRATDRGSATPPHAPTQSAAEGLQEKQEDGSNAIGGDDIPKFRRGKAPGAPPHSRNPHGKPQRAPPPPSGVRPPSKSGTDDKSFQLWGWCSPDEPLSSLRSCCADHLLLEGTCASVGEAGSSSEANIRSSSSSSINGTTGSCSVEAVAPGLVDAAWLLDLEATVQTALTDPQQEQQGVARSNVRSGCSRDTLKTVVDEVGFSVLEAGGEEAEAEGYGITEDPRLIEWFCRPKAPPLNQKPKPAGLKSSAGGTLLASTKDQQSFSTAKKETALLPASLRKNISISLCALRRGCPDRLNFLKRLQEDVLECSLNTSAIELLLELVPDMTVASDRRQLWIDAQEMLTKCGERIQRPLDDAERFTAFVLEFGALHQRLELLLFLNGKHMEAQLSSLLVQVQLKLDCLAMLRRRASRIAHCMKTVALAASVVRGLLQGSCCLLHTGEKTSREEAKENNAPASAGASEAAAGTLGTAPHSSGTFPPFRWPLLFQMVETHCGFSADGSVDRTRSLMKVIVSHVGKTLDSSELTLLKRAAQKPLVSILEQQSSLVRMLLLLHSAASRASSILHSATPQVQSGAPEDLIGALTARLLRCCHVCGYPPSSGERADRVQPEGKDLLLTVIPKLVMSHKARLETLARLVAQLLREYAAFICWMGDKKSFLPVQLHMHGGTGSKKEQHGGTQELSVPSILVSCLPSPTAYGEDGTPKLDAFKCLSTFLEKLAHQAEPPVASRPMGKHLLERRAYPASRVPVSPSSSSASSLLVHSPGSSQRGRKQQKRDASTLSTTAPLQEVKVRCLSMTSESDGRTPASLRALLSRTSASLVPPAAAPDAPNALRLSRLPGVSVVPTYKDTSRSPHVFPPALRIGCMGLAAPPGEEAATPFLCASPFLQSNTKPMQLNGEAGKEPFSGPPPEDSFAGLRRVLLGATDRKQLLTPSTSHSLPGLNNNNHSIPHALQCTTGASHCGAPETEKPRPSPYLKESLTCAVNPSEFSRGPLTSILYSRDPFASPVRIFFEKGSAALNEASSDEQTHQ